MFNVMFDEFNVHDLENGVIEVDVGCYIYNYSNCIHVYIKQTDDGKYSVSTDYGECVDVVDTLEDAKNVIYDLQCGVYAEHSSWWVKNHLDDNASEV